MKLPEDLRRVMRDSVRFYFAPLTGAIKGVRAELHRVEREAERGRHNEETRKRQSTRVG